MRLPNGETLVLSGADVDQLLDPASCVGAVEEAFGQQGRAAAPTGVLGMQALAGGFHVKAAAAPGWSFFAAKINANFPANPGNHGLPTIQGVVVLFDGTNGRPLAVLDSVRITALRTAAASAVAAKFLSTPGPARLFIAGCGAQARAHVDAIATVRPLEHITVYDLDASRARAFGRELERGGRRVTVAENVGSARASNLVVTCTPATHPILSLDHVAPGAFIAAVGADNEHKQELEPELMARARVVADSREQCIVMGDTRAAIASGRMTAGDICADLAQVVSGQRTPRTEPEQIVVFDSTGVALEDVAAATVVYQRALETGRGTWLRLGAAGSGRMGNSATTLERHRFIR